MQLSPALTDTLTAEIQTLVRQFSASAESADEDLLDSGILDSAGVVRLLLAVEARFGVAIPMEKVEMDSFRTVSGIAELVRKFKPAETARPLNMAAAYHLPATGDLPTESVPPPVADGLLEAIHDLFRNSLLVDVPSPDADLLRGGILDSMSLVSLIMLLETRFGLSLSLNDLDVAAFRTTTDIARLIRQHGTPLEDNVPNQTSK